MSEPMNVQEFMQRMRSFVVDEPDKLSMEVVAMCASMIFWSKETHRLVLCDFLTWIATLQADAGYASDKEMKEHLGDMWRRTQKVLEAKT